MFRTNDVRYWEKPVVITFANNWTYLLDLFSKTYYSIQQLLNTAKKKKYNTRSNILFFTVVSQNIIKKK